jgi:hypothetical protein
MDVYMDVYLHNLQEAWRWMLEPPWRHSGPSPWQKTHWLFWFLGTAWSLAGLVLGALVTPSLIRFAGLSDTFDQGAFVIGVAVLAGFLAQSLSCFVLVSALLFVALICYRCSLPYAVALTSGLLVCFTLAVLPFVGVGYALYHYVTWVGTGQGVVTTAFVGGLLVKTFLIPLIKGIVTGALFKLFLRWLRGGKPKSA